MANIPNIEEIVPVFTAVVKQSGPGWIGWIAEVSGVNAQERTRDELLESLKVALREALVPSSFHHRIWWHR